MQQKTKRIAFIILSIALCAILIAFLCPLFYKNMANSATTEITFPRGTRPTLADYFVISIKAANPRSIDFPKGTASIIWDSGEPLHIQKFDIFIDNTAHNYYVPIGENPYWQKTGQVERAEILLPQVDNIKVEVENISFNRRSLFPIDSAVNSFFRENFDLNHINRFQSPAAILFIAISILYSIYFLIFRPAGSKTNPIIITATTILVLFSFYFLQIQYHTIKSYYQAYQKSIKQREFSTTYQGFYDFEKFISWLDRNIPEDQNLILLVRGQPGYIMSEMAYNLYPKDIRFVNISEKEEQDIIEEITLINDRNNMAYSHIVALSEKDKISSHRLTLENSYRETGGFIYILNPQ
ncbi:MAG: hypothetical protein ACQEP2_05635 [Actinomycetota bacterium]